MKVIKQLVEKIDEELEDAESYIDLACEYKEKDRSLADTYYKLSLEEIVHMNMLHDQVVRIINDYKKNNEPPAPMQTLYDYIHEREIKWATKVKIKQEMYK